MAARSALAASFMFAQLTGAEAQVAPALSDLDKVRFAPASEPVRSGSAAERLGYNRYIVVCPMFGTKPLVALDTATAGTSGLSRFAEGEGLGALSTFAKELPAGSPLNNLFNAGTLEPGGVVRPAYTIRDYEALSDREETMESARRGMSATDRTEWQALARHALDFCAGRQP